MASPFHLVNPHAVALAKETVGLVHDQEAKVTQVKHVA
jgi:hypothetical protein